MEDKIRLSGRELDVMNVIWAVDKPLIAKDVVEQEPSLSINTVQAVLKTLLKKNFIKVNDIVYSGTVLTRNYVSVLSADEYMINQITKGISKHIAIEEIVSALLKQEPDEAEAIKRLEACLKQRKEELRKSK